MGNAQDLPILREPVQQVADDFRDTARDPRVHFVEYHGCRAAVPVCADLQRQADAGQFTAGGDFSQRQQRLAGVGGNEEFHLVVPVSVGFQVRARGDVDVKFPFRHAESAYPAADVRGHGRRAPAPAFAQFICGRAVFLQRPLLFPFEFRLARAIVFQPTQLFRYRLLVRVQLLRLHPVLAGHIVQFPQALFHLTQARGVLVRLVQVGAQFAGCLGNVQGRTLQQSGDVR